MTVQVQENQLKKNSKKQANAVSRLLTKLAAYQKSGFLCKNKLENVARDPGLSPFPIAIPLTRKTSTMQRSCHPYNIKSHWAPQWRGLVPCLWLWLGWQESTKVVGSPAAAHPQSGRPPLGSGMLKRRARQGWLESPRQPRIWLSLLGLIWDWASFPLAQRLNLMLFEIFYHVLYTQICMGLFKNCPSNGVKLNLYFINNCISYPIMFWLTLSTKRRSLLIIIEKKFLNYF